MSDREKERRKEFRLIVVLKFPSECGLGVLGVDPLKIATVAMGLHPSSTLGL